MFGDIQKKQEELASKIAQQRIEESLDNGSIKVIANGAGEWQEISISPDFFENNDKDKLEDLLVVMANVIQQKSMAIQAEAQQSLLQNMMPGGFSMDQLKDLF